MFRFHLKKETLNVFRNINRCSLHKIAIQMNFGQCSEFFWAMCSDEICAFRNFPLVPAASAAASSFYLPAFRVLGVVSMEKVLARVRDPAGVFSCGSFPANGQFQLARFIRCHYVLVALANCFRLLLALGVIHESISAFIFTEIVAFAYGIFVVIHQFCLLFEFRFVQSYVEATYQIGLSCAFSSKARTSAAAWGRCRRRGGNRRGRRRGRRCNRRRVSSWFEVRVVRIMGVVLIISTTLIMQVACARGCVVHRCIFATIVLVASLSASGLQFVECPSHGTKIRSHVPSWALHSWSPFSRCSGDGSRSCNSSASCTARWSLNFAVLH